MSQPPSNTLTDTVKRYWDQLVAWIKSVWDQIVNSFKGGSGNSGVRETPLVTGEDPVEAPKESVYMPSESQAAAFIKKHTYTRRPYVTTIKTRSGKTETRTGSTLVRTSSIGKKFYVSDAAAKSAAAKRASGWG